MERDDELSASIRNVREQIRDAIRSGGTGKARMQLAAAIIDVATTELAAASDAALEQLADSIAQIMAPVVATAPNGVK